MDLVNEKKVHYLGCSCADCGSFASPQSIMMQIPDDLHLCSGCLTERHVSQEDMRKKVRKHFDLGRSPNLRSCFLKMLLSHKINLEPSGWRTGLALGLELKSAGFAANESRQILLKVGADLDRAEMLIGAIYKENDSGPLNCRQIRGMNVICEGCPDQFRVYQQENKTEIGPQNAGYSDKNKAEERLLLL